MSYSESCCILNLVVLRSLLESVGTEESAVVMLPDFTLTELQNLVDLVYRRETSLDTSQLQDCLKLTNIYKERNVFVNCFISLSDCQTSDQICKSMYSIYILLVVIQISADSDQPQDLRLHKPERESFTLNQTYLHSTHSSVRNSYQDHFNNNKAEKKRKLRQEFFKFS